MECDWEVRVETCQGCFGLGVMAWYGMCFACNGTGRIEYEGPPR